MVVNAAQKIPCSHADCNFSEVYKPKQAHYLRYPTPKVKDTHLRMSAAVYGIASLFGGGHMMAGALYGATSHILRASNKHIENPLKRLLHDTIACLGTATLLEKCGMKVPSAFVAVPVLLSAVTVAYNGIQKLNANLKMDQAHDLYHSLDMKALNKTISDNDTDVVIGMPIPIIESDVTDFVTGVEAETTEEKGEEFETDSDDGMIMVQDLIDAENAEIENSKSTKTTEEVTEEQIETDSDDGDIITIEELENEIARRSEMQDDSKVSNDIHHFTAEELENALKHTSETQKDNSDLQLSQFNLEGEDFFSLFNEMNKEGIETA